MESIWNNLTNWFTGLTVQDFWSPQTLISLTPPASWKFSWIYLGITVLFFIAALVLIKLKLHPELKTRIYPLLITEGLLGLIIYFFRSQRIPLLGMDIWRVLQEVSVLVWIALIIWYYLKGHKSVLVQEEVIAYKNKYLPKAKK